MAPIPGRNLKAERRASPHRKAPSSPLALAMAPVIAKAQQLGRIQSQCLMKRLSWAAYYTELGNLRLLQLKCEDEIKELYK